MQNDPGPRKLAKNLEHRQLSGVCAGIADYFNVDRNMVRIAALLLLVFTGGSALFAYIAAALFVPIRDEDRAAGRKTSVLAVVFLIIVIGAIIGVFMP